MGTPPTSHFPTHMLCLGFSISRTSHSHSHSHIAAKATISIGEGNDLAAAISVGVTTVVLRCASKQHYFGLPPFSGRLVKRAYDALLLDAGGTLLQLVKPVEETYDAMIKHLEATVSATRLDMESLNSKMEELHVGLKFKEDSIQCLRISEEILEKEKTMEKPMIRFNINQVSNYSYGEAEALTDDIEEESQVFGEVFRIKKIIDNCQDEALEITVWCDGMEY